MVANNLLEIYTLMFAWNMYEAIWDLLTGTGLAFVPFIAAVVSSFKDNYSSDHGSAKSAVASLEVSTIGMILVLMLCVIPFQNKDIKLSTVKYSFAVKDCNPPANSDVSGTGDNTNTGFDDGFSDVSGGFTIHRPLMWSFAETLSSAITHSAIQSMTCANNYDYMLLRVASASFSEPLKERVIDFTQACYKVAMSEIEKNPLLAASIETASSGYSRVQDIDWIGSRILVSGYTDSLYNAPEAYMSGMGKHDFTRRTSQRETDKGTESGAHPSCREVWEGEGAGLSGWTFGGAKGLRQLLLEDVPFDKAGSIMDDWMDWGSEAITIGTVDDKTKEDLLLKMILQVHRQGLSEQTEVDLKNDFDVGQSWGEKAIDTITGVATVFTEADEYLKTTAIKQIMKIVGPMLLALLQMILIIAAPFVMVMGGYQFSTFIQLAMSYFALEFINAIFAITFWFDQRVLDIYLSQNGWFDNPSANLIIHSVSAGSMLLLPMIWLGIMSMAGAGFARSMGGPLSGRAGGSGAAVGTRSTTGAGPRSKAKSSWTNYRSGKK